MVSGRNLLIVCFVIAITMLQIMWTSLGGVDRILNKRSNNADKVTHKVVWVDHEVDLGGPATWRAGAPGAGCERSRLHSSYTALFVKVVSGVGLPHRPPSPSTHHSGDECPFSHGTDEWSVSKFFNQSSLIFEREYMKPHPPVVGEAPPFVSCAKDDVSTDNATAQVSQEEIKTIERVKQLYLLYRQEIQSTYATAPLMYHSDSCWGVFPASVIASCLTAATLAATSSELSHMKEPSFSIFSSIHRFRNTVCAHWMPCHTWRSGHWQDAHLSSGHNSSMPNATTVTTNNGGDGGDVIQPFASMFMATVGPSNPNSKSDLRRLRERHTTIFPWADISMSPPRYRALRVGHAEVEFNYTRGLFTSRRVGGVGGGVLRPLDLPPNIFYSRVVKASRSMLQLENGTLHQRFPSLVVVDGDSLYRGLYYSTVQRIREHSLGASTYPSLGATNVYDALPPVPSTGAHGDSVYFIYPTPTGKVDLLVDRHGLYGYEEIDVMKYREQRRKCARVLGGLVSRCHGEHDCTASLQVWIIKFLASTMIGLPDTIDGNVSTDNATYANRTYIGAEWAHNVILYAHIICGSPPKGSSFPPSFSCPIVAVYYTFNNLQQQVRRDTWSSKSGVAAQKMFKSALGVNNVSSDTSPLSNAVNVGMRIHGAGGWDNSFPETILHSAALSADDSAEPPITINRLATLHFRANQREACAIIQMREGVCSSPNRTSPGSDITGLCSFISPRDFGSHPRKSWDGFTDAHIRVGGDISNDASPHIQKNLRFEGYARALTAIWEAALDTDPTGTVFSDWCTSNTSGGLKDETLTPRVESRDVSDRLSQLCAISEKLVDAVRSSALKTNTIFYDAALLRSLSPFSTRDHIHYDCSIRTIASEAYVHGESSDLSGYFAFPNNTLRAMTSTAESSMCATRSLDAAGLSYLLTSSFSTDMNVTVFYESVPAARDGSLVLVFPLSYSNDHCRSTFQRSELSLMFGVV